MSNLLTMPDREGVYRCRKGFPFTTGTTPRTDGRSWRKTPEAAARRKNTAIAMMDGPAT